MRSRRCGTQGRRRAADDQAIVAQVAYTASGEASIGELFADVVRRLGRSGALELEMGHSRKDEFEVVEGARYGQGFLSPYFVTDRRARSRNSNALTY